MVGLLMLFGKRPFVDLTVYETIPAIQILAESTRLQLEDVLDQLSGPDGDFKQYREAVATGNKNCELLRNITIPEGTLPQETPLELFLLIAGLMHPNYKIRLSVSEALCCPFLEIEDVYEDNHVSIASVQRGMQYEEVTQSMSRLERIRDSNLS